VFAVRLLARFWATDVAVITKCAKLFILAAGARRRDRWTSAVCACVGLGADHRL